MREREREKSARDTSKFVTSCPIETFLQHTATYSNTLQHTATYCNILQHTATYCNTLQHTATPVTIFPIPRVFVFWISLHFTRSGIPVPAAGVVVEKGSEYTLAHTGPRELDGCPHREGWVGVVSR